MSEANAAQQPPVDDAPNPIEVIGAILTNAATSLTHIDRAMLPALGYLPRTHQAITIKQGFDTARAIAKPEHRATLDATELQVWAAALIHTATVYATEALELVGELHREISGQRTPPSPIVALDGQPVEQGGSVLVDLQGRPIFADRTGNLTASPGEVWVHPPRPDPITPLSPPFAIPTCTRCGCTDQQPCTRQIDAGGAPATVTCGWARLDDSNNAGLCTACAR